MKITLALFLNTKKKYLEYLGLDYTLSGYVTLILNRIRDNLIFFNIRIKIININYTREKIKIVGRKKKSK